MPDQEFSVVPELVIGIAAGAADVRAAERPRAVAKALGIVVVLGIEIVSSRAGLETQPDAITLEQRPILQTSGSTHRPTPRDPVLLQLVAKIDSGRTVIARLA